jgi:hypothetical protein
VATDVSIPPKEPIVAADLQVGSSTTAEVAEKLVSLCNRYRDCFAKSIQEIGCHPTAQMTIALTSDDVVNDKRQPHSYAERQRVEELITELKGADVIEEGRGPYCSPLVVLRKKDGSHRVCVDYRRLNSITMKENYPCPHIDELLDDTKGWRTYAMLDLASGYYQVSVEEESRQYTAFPQRPDITSLSECRSDSSTRRSSSTA